MFFEQKLILDGVPLSFFLSATLKSGNLPALWAQTFKLNIFRCFNETAFSRQSQTND